MKLIDILNKMKVVDLKKEISKQNIKGYSKLKKADIIKIMTDRPDRFKYLLLQNMEQKKEILQNKVKLKEAKAKMKKLSNTIDPNDFSYLGITNEEAEELLGIKKEKMQKLTAKKKLAKKAQQAEVIKPKPKRKPMIPKIIKTKTGVVTVKPKFSISKEKIDEIVKKIIKKEGKLNLSSLLYELQFKEKLSEEEAEKIMNFVENKRGEDQYEKELKEAKKEECPKSSSKVEFKTNDNKNVKFCAKSKKDKDEIKIKTFEKEIKTLKVKLDQSPSPITSKNINISERNKRQQFRDKLRNEINSLEFKISIIKDKQEIQKKEKQKKDKQKKEKEEQKKEQEEIKKTKKLVEDFIKNPTEELLQDIDNSENFDELPEKLQERAEKAIEKFLKKDKKKKVNKKTEEPKKLKNEIIKYKNNNKSEMNKLDSNEIPLLFMRNEKIVKKIFKTTNPNELKKKIKILLFDMMKNGYETKDYRKDFMEYLKNEHNLNLDSLREMVNKKPEEPKKEKLKDCPVENHELKFTKDYKDFLKQSRTVHPDKNKGCVELAKKMFQQLQIHYSKYKTPELREIANIVKNFEYTVNKRDDKVIIELDAKSSKSIKRNELQDLRNKLKQLNPNYRINQKM